MGGRCYSWFLYSTLGGERDPGGSPGEGGTFTQRRKSGRRSPREARVETAKRERRRRGIPGVRIVRKPAQLAPLGRERGREIFCYRGNSMVLTRVRLYDSDLNGLASRLVSNIDQPAAGPPRSPPSSPTTSRHISTLPILQHLPSSTSPPP